MKARSTFRFSQPGLDYVGGKQWARGGSKVYPWTQCEVEETVRYVLQEQGELMQAVLYQPRRSLTLAVPPARHDGC